MTRREEILKLLDQLILVASCMPTQDQEDRMMNIILRIKELF